MSLWLPRSTGRSSETEDNYHLWLLPLVPRGEPRPLLKTPANDRLAHVSPDGRWMAYVSDDGGRDEIWVRASPEGDAAVQVSRDGGTEPLLAPDGRVTDTTTPRGPGRPRSAWGCR